MIVIKKTTEKAKEKANFPVLTWHALRFSSGLYVSLISSKSFPDGT
jgi:choline-glycine betaine transporter